MRCAVENTTPMSCSVKSSVSPRSVAMRRKQRHRVARLGRRHAGGRLVEQQQLGPAGEGDAELELLLVAVRQRAAGERSLVEQVDVAQQGLRLVAEQVFGARPQVAAAAAVGDDRRLHVLEHRELGEDVGALERAPDAERAQAVRREAR